MFKAVFIGFWIVLLLLMLQMIYYPNFWQKNKSENTDVLKNLTIQDPAKLYDEVRQSVIPEEGKKTKLKIKNVLLQLIQYDVIDKDKFYSLYAKRDLGGINLDKILEGQFNEEIILNADNADFWLNVFWAIGLANKTEFNKNSPINGENLYNFASTGGWTLGKADNGGEYFNKYPFIKLNENQEKLVLEIAESSYRPCCNNHTFFQDCNHGSALLGVLELAASQGFKEKELYELAADFNSYWFPDQYIQVALYFEIIKNQDWHQVDKKLALSQKYSSSSGFNNTVAARISQIPDLLPQNKNKQKCSV